MPNVIEVADAAAGTGTAYALAVGQTAQGNLSTGADDDWFKVDLVAGQTYTFALTGTGTNNVIDPYIELRGPGGATVLASNDDGLANNNSLLTFTATTTGAYYVVAGAYGDSGPGQYGVSVTAGTRASFDNQMIAGVIDTDQSWSGTPGTGATITWAFRQTFSGTVDAEGNAAPGSQLTAAQQAAVIAALSAYAEVAGVTFVQVNPGGFSDNATILFGNYQSATDGAGAYAWYPGSTASSAQDGDVWLNRQHVSTTSLPPGSYDYATIIHELGHALGLSHPGLYNASPTGNPTYASDAQFIQDTNQYSVMSYFDESNSTQSWGGESDTPMVADILAMQNIYGSNTATRSGNTTYGFNSNAGGVYDFTTNTSPVLTIWDGAGTDTIDTSGYSGPQTIRLADGSFSSIGGLTDNIAIAVNAVIENAIGGSGNDLIIGNAVGNVLTGNNGADTLIGGAGFDTYNGGAGNDLALIEVAHRDITSRTATTLGHSGGTEGLSSIETFAFLDVDLVGTRQTGNAFYRDVTGDNRVDLVMETDNHTFYFAAGTNAGAGGGGLSAATVGLTHGGPAGFIRDQVQFADVNGDGRVDSVFQGLDNRFWANFGTAGGFTGATLVAQHGGPFSPTQVSYADVNGDTRADLIFHGVDNRFWVNFGTGSGFTGASLVAQHGGPFNPDQVEFADVNGDSFADLVFQGVDNRFWINFGNGTGFGGAVLASSALNTQAYVAGQAHYADLNNDNRDDLIFQATDNNIYTALSTGTTFAAPVIAASISHDPFQVHAVQLADMNNDGRADLMYQAADNDFWYYQSNGSTFATGQMVLDQPGAFAEASAGYGDVNGDGQGDIVYQDANNDFWVSLKGIDWLA